MSTDLRFEGREIIKIWPWIGPYTYAAIDCLLMASRYSLFGTETEVLAGTNPAWQFYRTEDSGTTWTQAQRGARAIEFRKAARYLNMEIARLTGPYRFGYHLQYLWTILRNVGGVASAAAEEELAALAKTDQSLYIALMLVKKRILLSDRVAGLKLASGCLKLIE